MKPRFTYLRPWVHLLGWALSALYRFAVSLMKQPVAGRAQAQAQATQSVDFAH